MSKASISALAAGRAKRWPSFDERFAANVERTSGCWNWTAGEIRGYGYIDKCGMKVMAHRAAFESANGEIPDGMQVDHICRNRRCVRPDHLRLASNKQNAEHKSLPVTNTSGFRGVTRHRDGIRWVAQVKHNQRNYYLGIFDSAELAGSAARQKRLQLFTHNNDDRHPTEAPDV